VRRGFIIEKYNKRSRVALYRGDLRSVSSPSRRIVSNCRKQQGMCVIKVQRFYLFKLEDKRLIDMPAVSDNDTELLSFRRKCSRGKNEALKMKYCNWSVRISNSTRGLM
jgi:hypothetical protein